MDLKEKSGVSLARHPWETARVEALKLVLKKLDPEQKRSVLDVGCGDGFVSAELFKNLKMVRLTGVDANFTDEEMKIAASTYPGAEFHTNIEEVGQDQFDLVLMLDVLEHVENDTDHLNGIVTNKLKPGGHLLITVPAFQFLFSEHDRFLRHFRRYSLIALRSLIARAGIESIGEGYLFASLLPARIASLCLEKLAPGMTPKPIGIGSWRRGPLATRLVELVLRVDNRVLFSLGKHDLFIPGLTVWMLCRKPQS